MWLLTSLIFYLSIDIVLSTVDYLQHPVKSCHIGDVVENECNKCLCTSKAVFECTPLDCDKNKRTEELSATSQLCYPNQLYVKNLITCICTKDGRWPHKSCHDNFMALPPSKVIKQKCYPDTYVFIDCNVCRCGPDGEINSDRCTRNSCDEDIKRRAANFGPNSVYSNCEVKNWYSLAPCQFCFCVNTNKLVCNTGNYYSKKLELGSYNLRICGKDLIREAIELIPDNQKMLRLGYNLNLTGTTAEPKAAGKTSILTTELPGQLTEEQNIAIEVNRESNENKTKQVKSSNKQTKQEDLSSSKEYYTDSEEELAPQPQTIQKPVTVPRTTTVVTTVQTITTELPDSKGPSTMFPFEEGDEMLNESGMKTDEDNEDDTDEILVDLDTVAIASPKEVPNVDTHTSPQKNKHTEQSKGSKASQASAESYQYIGNTLRINLPRVLNKVFALALRKSMVSLSNQTKCTPGTATANDCNMCFCLKNSKLLCTNKKCSKKE